MPDELLCVRTIQIPKFNPEDGEPILDQETKQQAVDDKTCGHPESWHIPGACYGQAPGLEMAEDVRCEIACPGYLAPS